MSLETRTTSALYKRAEQLKRWEESDTNRETLTTKQKSRKVKFSSGCVFLAACAAGDKDEVVKLLQKGADINTANVDGLTALHQACIDDNLDMVEFLVEHGADVTRGDNEGWTPLHATASCGFLYIAKYLLEKGANVASVNNDGELPLDIAESPRMEDLLKEEIEKRGIDCEAARNEEQMIMLRDAKDWLATKSSLVNVPHPKNGATPLHVASAKGYVDVIKILLQCGADIDSKDVDGWTPIHAAAHWGQKEVCQLLVESYADLDAKNYVGQTAFDLCDSEMLSYLEDLRKKQNKEEMFNRRLAKKRPEDIIPESDTPIKVKKVEVAPENEVKTDLTNEKKTKTDTLPAEKSTNPPTTLAEKIDDMEENLPWRKVPIVNNSDLSPTKTSIISNISISSDLDNDTEVTIRIPPSKQKEKENRREDSTESNSITSSSNVSSEKASPATSPQPTNQQPLRSGLKLDIPSTTSTTTTSNTTSTTNSTPSTPTTPGGNRLQMLKNFFKSFVPPVRDEESETQRKAHAKRVRETRRSTQGVTLEEIKSAEQFVKNKNGTNNSTCETPASNRDSANGLVVSTTITTGTPTVKTTRENEDVPAVHERRPSWRLRVDNGTSKFELEDASKNTDPPTTASFIRRTNTTTVPAPRPSSAPLETAEATVTIALRRPKSVEEKEQDKENDIRNAQATLATQSAIQRRRRPKRRSTGVVSFDGVDDLDQEKDPSNTKDCDETAKSNHIESGTDRSSRSRISSTSDIRNENGEIDYKKLYEQQLVENDRLKEKLKKSDEELRETKQTLEKINLVTSKNSLSELEKRERRAMERKLSEMEEELKQLQKLKAENERLKADNRSLTRVVNKLTNSAKK